MVKNIIIKKGVIRNLNDRESLTTTVLELQEKFKDDRRVKVLLDEVPVRDEMIGYEEFVNNSGEEFCSIVDGGSDDFINMLLNEGGKKKFLDSLNSFIKSKYVLYISVRFDENQKRLEDSNK